MHKIRNATRTDIPHIVRFNAAMALETENIVLETDILTSGVTALMKDPEKGFYIVAETESEIRACLLITYEWSDWRNGLFWWIQSVYVEKQYRKAGLFKLMYNHIRDLIDKKQTIVGLRLYVDQENVNAQKVYESMGMSKTNYQLYEFEK